MSGSGTGVLDAPPALHLPGIERKSAAVTDAGSGVLDLDDKTGEVEALVSVTGVEDEVKDIIIPGAYAKTLGKRKPKGVFSHDWGRWVARTEIVEEWMPGDSRLPKETREGKAWPKEAGALYVKMRFNLKSREGRDAYENVKFFSETGECEWSIGYHVPDGKGIRDKRGVRHIKELDLFEYSPVLFGAAPLSGTLAVKSRLAAIAEGQTHDDIEDSFIRLLHEDGMGEVDWDVVEEASAALEAKAFEAALEAKAEGGHDRNRGNAEQLRRWYVHGGGAARIRWGEGGDFMRCVRLAGKHMTPERAKGYCALRHRDATGGWPGHAPTEVGGKGLVSEWLPDAEVGEYASTKEIGTEGVEVKEYPFLAGCIEGTQAALRVALDERLLGAHLSDDDDAGAPSLSGGRREWSYVEVVGTFPDRGQVIARRSAWGGPNAGQNETYQLDYTVNQDGTVDLGDPEPVWIEVTAEVMTAGVDRADDEDAPSPGPEYVLLGALKGIEQCTLSVQVAAHFAAETKAGRVLSGANETRLKAAVEHLVAVLDAAGVRINTAPGTDPDALTKPTTTPDSTAPTARAADSNGAGAKVTLDPAEVKARIAALRG